MLFIESHITMVTAANIGVYVLLFLAYIQGLVHQQCLAGWITQCWACASENTGTGHGTGLGGGYNSQKPKSRRPSGTLSQQKEQGGEVVHVIVREAEAAGRQAATGWVANCQ